MIYDFSPSGIDKNLEFRMPFEKIGFCKVKYNPETKGA